MPLLSARRSFLILGILFAITAFDTLLLGFAIPKLITQYGLTRSQAGLLGTILMAGVGIGALVLGTVSDFVGRKRVILASVVTFTFSTGLLSFAGSFISFAILLFTSGFGLGGGLTMGIAYLPDIIDNRSSLDKYMCYLESFWGIGAFSIVTASYILTERPLKELFLVGATPLLLLPIFFKLPDIRPSEKGSLSGNIRDLVSEYGKITIILWVIWFCGVYTYYGVFLWLPDVIVSMGGYEIGNTTLIPVYGIQILSPLLLSFIVREGNTEKLLALYSLMAAVSTLIFIFSQKLSTMILGMLVTSFFSIGGWVLFILATQKSYPQKIRGFGVGSAASIGRIGGIAAPYLTGYFMDVYGTFVIPFAIFAALFLVMAVLAAFLAMQ